MKYFTLFLSQYFSAIILLKIKMITMTPQSTIQTPYTMDSGYDKNSRPSKPSTCYVNALCMRLSCLLSFFRCRCYYCSYCCFFFFCPWKCWRMRKWMSIGWCKATTTRHWTKLSWFRKSRRNLRFDWQSKRNHGFYFERETHWTF